MGLDGRFRDIELKGDLLVEQTLPSIIRTRTCCGVRVDKRATSSVDSPTGWLRSTSAGSQISPPMMLQIASRMRSTGWDLGMNPEAPQSRQCAGSCRGHRWPTRSPRGPPDVGPSNRADRRPRGRPACVRSSKMRSISARAPSRSVSSSSEPASCTCGVLERGSQGLAQRPSKQWVVIDDDELVGGHLWIRYASSLRNGASRPLAASASWLGNLAVFLAKWLIVRCIYALTHPGPRPRRCGCQPPHLNHGSQAVLTRPVGPGRHLPPAFTTSQHHDRAQRAQSLLAAHQVQMLTSLLPFLLAIDHSAAFTPTPSTTSGYSGCRSGISLACHGLMVIAFITVAVFINRQDAIDHWHRGARGLLTAWRLLRVPGSSIRASAPTSVFFTAAFGGAGVDGVDVRATWRGGRPAARLDVCGASFALCGDRLQRACARGRDYFASGRRVPAFFNGLVLGGRGAGRGGLPRPHRCAVYRGLRCPMFRASAGVPAWCSWRCYSPLRAQVRHLYGSRLPRSAV